MSRKGPAPELQGVEVALAPEELELDPMAMTQKYEEHVREQQAQVEKEDFSDMVAEHAAKQKVGLTPEAWAGDWDSFFSGVVSSSGESEGGLCLLPKLPGCWKPWKCPGGLSSSGMMKQAQGGEGTYTSLRIQFQHFFHRHVAVSGCPPLFWGSVGG